MASLRLLKIQIQPVFVLDDGENLTEQQGQVLTVTPAQWEQFSSSFIEDIKRVSSEFAAQDDEGGIAVGDDG